MQDKRVIINRGFVQKLIVIFNHPVFQLVLSTLIGLFLFWIALTSKTPYYFVTDPITVDTHIRNELKLTFHDQHVSDLHFVDLVFWNNGEQFIDYSDFVHSKPITVYGGNAIKLLSVNTVIQSRTDLHFEGRIDKNKLVIKLKEDEALETGDGVMFRVYYTSKSSSPPTLEVSSRIKGTKNGFTFKDLKKNLKTEHTSRVLIGWVVIFSVIMIRVVSLAIARKAIVFRTSEMIVLGLLTIIWSWYTYDYIYYAIDLEWVVGFIS